MRLPITAAALLLSLCANAELTIETLIEEAGLTEGDVPSREMPGWRVPQKIVVPDGYVPLLENEFPDIEFVGASNAADAVDKVADADAILAWCADDIVAAGTRLLWIQIFSSGAERCMVVDAIADGEILLTNGQKMTSPAIGEHAIAMTLALSRQLVQYAKNMPSGEWQRDNSIETLSGKTMLVAGLGGIGRETARRAHALGMRVVATRNSSREGPDYVDYVGLSPELLELAADADVVVNALPLTPKTRGLFDKNFFDTAKPGLIFINVARGGSVVTADLVAALEDGRVSAAGLDVTDPEPLPADHVLWQMPNVLITPHIAWAGADRDRGRLLAIENIRRFIAGDALLNVVDPAEGY